MATTFEVLKGSVENLLKRYALLQLASARSSSHMRLFGRPLELNDIAQIKSLLPEVITFAYISSDQLRVHASAAPDDEDPHAAAREKKRLELDEAYRAGAIGEAAKDLEKTDKGSNSTVLLFSFNDGELRSENGVGKVMRKKFQCVTPAAVLPSLELLTGGRIVQEETEKGGGAFSLPSSSSRNRTQVFDRVDDDPH